jgi:hypothetical protein
MPHYISFCRHIVFVHSVYNLLRCKESACLLPRKIDRPPYSCTTYEAPHYAVFSNLLSLFNDVDNSSGHMTSNTRLIIQE